jgi:hypothetical protein
VDFWCLARWPFWVNWLSHSGHLNFWPICTDLWWVSRLPFWVNWTSHCGHWNLWPICTDFWWVTSKDGLYQVLVNNTIFNTILDKNMQNYTILYTNNILGFVKKHQLFWITLKHSFPGLFCFTDSRNIKLFIGRCHFPCPLFQPNLAENSKDFQNL